LFPFFQDVPFIAPDLKDIPLARKPCLPLSKPGSVLSLDCTDFNIFVRPSLIPAGFTSSQIIVETVQNLFLNAFAHTGEESWH
jgi:hypothetical protein